MDVVGAPVTVTNLQVNLTLVGGFLAPDEVEVVSEVTAEVLELPVEEGTAVEEGDLLVRLDDAKILSRLREARSRITLAQATFTRAETLRGTNSISEQEFDEARAAVDQAEASFALLREEFDDTRIHAPMSGRIGEHHISRGQVVQAGHTLMNLVRLDPLEVRFEVPERHIGGLADGLKVEVLTDAYPGETFTGRVSYLSPQLNRATRTLGVKATVPNPEGRLKPGMFGRVNLVLDEIPDAMFVPESAVRQRGADTVVFVRNEKGRAEPRDVTVGLRQGGRMQIEEGLSPEDIVVAEGLIKIGPGMLLNFSEDSRRYGIEPSKAPTPAPETEPAPES